jgi:putative nucleotidyltransferase with HDIG domain
VRSGSGRHSPLVSRYTQELLTLPAQPAAAERVLRIVSNRKAGAADLARVVETDPALAARVMRLANSPYYGSPRRVSSTRHATVMLGFDTVRAMAASAACSLLDGRFELGPDGFWRHAITTAATASVIARRVGLSTEDAFTVGLLHDLGAVLLHRRDARAFAIATESATVSEQVAAELAAFGVTHADEGAAALDAWAFPEPFIEAIALHQHGIEEPKHALGRVLRVAEAVALEHAPMPGYPATPDIDRLFAAVGLRSDDYDVVTREVDNQLERIADLLGVDS